MHPSLSEEGRQESTGKGVKVSATEPVVYLERMHRHSEAWVEFEEGLERMVLEDVR